MKKVSAQVDSSMKDEQKGEMKQQGMKMDEAKKPSSQDCIGLILTLAYRGPS